eukprot:16430068-Heterocapsa_arctica.AAC.1
MRRRPGPESSCPSWTRVWTSPSTSTQGCVTRSASRGVSRGARAAAAQAGLSPPRPWPPSASASTSWPGARY